MAGARASGGEAHRGGRDARGAGQQAGPPPAAHRKALADDTLLVYGLNGQPLTQDHGFPVRLLVPGWVGVASIKWVGRIDVSNSPRFSPWNTETYVMLGDAYPDRPVLTPRR